MARCGQAACRHTGHQLKLLQCSESMCALSHSPCDFWAHFPCLAACCPRHVFLRRKHQKAIILLANESLSHGTKILGSHRHHDIQNSRFRTCLGDKHSQSKPITLASILGFVGPPWTLHPRRHGDMRHRFKLYWAWKNLWATEGLCANTILYTVFLHFIVRKQHANKICKNMQNKMCSKGAVPAKDSSNTPPFHFTAYYICDYVAVGGSGNLKHLIALSARRWRRPRLCQWALESFWPTLTGAIWKMCAGRLKC